MASHPPSLKGLNSSRQSAIPDFFGNALNRTRSADDLSPILRVILYLGSGFALWNIEVQLIALVRTFMSSAACSCGMSNTIEILSMNGFGRVWVLLEAPSGSCRACALGNTGKPRRTKHAKLHSR